MKKLICTLLPLTLLTGCAMLPGQDSDYSRFCNVSGRAGTGEIYRITDWQEFRLTPSGKYLSEREFAAQDSSTMAQLQGILQGASAETERANAVQVRVYKAESEQGNKGSCLPVRYTDSDRERKFSTLTKGRRLMVYAENEGQSGQQIYNKSGMAGFSYRLL